MPNTYESESGGWALIDHPHAGHDTPVGLVVNGDHVILDHLGIHNRSSDRGDLTLTALDTGWRGGGIHCFGANCSSRHLVVTDGGEGVDSWASALGGEIYGCLILDNGWQGGDRGHGHGIYTQNVPGATKTLKHNVIAGQFSTNIKTSGSGADVSSFAVVENTCMFPGYRDVTPEGSVGSGAAMQHYKSDGVSEDMLWSGNRAYCPDRTAWTSWFASNATHLDATLLNQWLYGYNGIVFTRPWTTVTVQGHTVRAGPSGRLFGYENTPTPTTLSLSGNTYFGGKASPFKYAGSDLTFAQWQAETGQDADSAHYPNDEPPARVWVDPDGYTPKRAVVTVWNPTEATSVGADLDAVLSNGDPWYLYNALNPYAGPVTSGTYVTGAGIEVPMTGIVNRTPAGTYALPFDPKFHAFVVLPTATWVAP